MVGKTHSTPYPLSIPNPLDTPSYLLHQHHQLFQLERMISPDIPLSLYIISFSASTSKHFEVFDHRILSVHHLICNLQIEALFVIMGTEAPAAQPFFWGHQPEDEFYTSQGVKNQQAFHQTPYGRIFTQSFHPINRETRELLPIKGSVYMTHGYGSDTGWLFQTIAMAFADWGYAAFCADLLGHGRSDGIRCYVGDFEAVAGASLNFFLSVRRKPEYADLPAFLFGESMGGAATMIMYLRSPPDTWTGLMFSAPLFVIPEDMKPSKLRLFLFGLLFGLADTWQAMPDGKMVGKSIRDPERLRIFALNPRRYIGPPRVGTMRELARICEYIQKSFHKVTAPFLTVHGTEDIVTAPEGSQMLYERAASADKSLILYEGLYHSLIQGESEENRTRVLGDLKEWIDDRTKRYGNGVSRVVNSDGDGGRVAGSEDKEVAAAAV